MSKAALCATRIVPSAKRWNDRSTCCYVRLSLQHFRAWMPWIRIDSGRSGAFGFYQLFEALGYQQAGR